MKERIESWYNENLVGKNRGEVVAVIDELMSDDVPINTDTFIKLQLAHDALVRIDVPTGKLTISFSDGTKEEVEVWNNSQQNFDVLDTPEFGELAKIFDEMGKDVNCGVPPKHCTGNY